MTTDAYVLDTAGLNYSADVEDILTYPFSQVQAFTDGKLLRRVAGVAGGIAVYCIAPDTFTYTDGFTSGLGDKHVPVYAGGLSSGTSDLTWQSSGGRTDSGCAGNGVETGGAYHCLLGVDLGDEFTVTAISMWHVEGAAGQGQVRSIRTFRNDKSIQQVLLSSSTASVTTYDQISWSGTSTDRRYIMAGATVVPAGLSCLGDDLSVTYEGYAPTILYSDDYGATLNTVNLGECGSTFTPAFDVDDYNLGIFVASLGNRIVYTSSYTQANATELTGLAGTGSGAKVRCIRVPFLKASTSPNNSANSFEFIYSMSDGYTGRVIFNASTGVIASETDISVIVSATTYTVLGANSLVTFGGDSRKIRAIAQTGSSTPRLFVSNSGGAAGTWLDRGAITGATAITVLEPSAGNGDQLYTSTSSGARFSHDNGLTIVSASGDMNSETGSNVALGFFPL